MNLENLLLRVMATSNTTLEVITVPEKLPFSESICWQTGDVYRFTPEQMLNRYELGYSYHDLFNNLEGEELKFLQKLAKRYNSWLQATL